jgi:hypothetical protein
MSKTSRKWATTCPRTARRRLASPSPPPSPPTPAEPAAGPHVSLFFPDARERIEVYRLAYEQQGDPFQVWNAYDLARSARLEIPAWVLAYFDQVAERLLALTRPRRPPTDPRLEAPGQLIANSDEISRLLLLDPIWPKGKALRSQVAAALGFKGGPGIFARRRVAHQHEELASSVAALVKAG